MRSMWNLEVDELRQQKAMLGSAPVSQNQKTEAIVGTGSPRSDFSEGQKNVAWSDKS